MRVGWLADDPGYLGGAELTQQEFAAAAPDEVEIVACPPGEVVAGLDRYVAHNVVHYRSADIPPGPIVWYHHDLSPHIDPDLRARLDAVATHIFCSPMHRLRYGRDGECVPPPVDLDRYAPTRQIRRNRSGTCSIAGWRGPGKGAQLLKEWADANGPVDVYGGGDFAPVADSLTYRGEIAPEGVASVLHRYERFVFLPTAFEPFCRSVVEAWAAGCEVITNGLVGARHYIERDQDALRTAARDFWRVVL